ncbi:DUF998 domain-containing protein [Herbiconiux moechotypicola]|uniref:Uncharacterized protein n=1 Tax=Herbiconiux moechotypicola TaxID=637393 RepID=A0ABN3DUJ1_9MICO|nr:DUF998 domain-containing protein [Herbiconiux moechotypicola]MCS5731059.1 DUF998 domain-containing protein [Herbiconiux moechotypicola]
MSQYHLTRSRPVIVVSTAFSILAGIGAILVLTALAGAAAIIADLLLGVFTLARILMPLLPMDAPGSPATTRGRTHNVLAILNFAAVTAAAFVAGGLLHDEGFAAAATWSTVFGIVAAVGAAGLLAGIVARRPSLFGLFERVIYLGFIPWFALIGVVALSA